MWSVINFIQRHSLNFWFMYCLLYQKPAVLVMSKNEQRYGSWKCHYPKASRVMCPKPTHSKSKQPLLLLLITKYIFLFKLFVSIYLAEFPKKMIRIHPLCMCAYTAYSYVWMFSYSSTWRGKLISPEFDQRIKLSNPSNFLQVLLN